MLRNASARPPACWACEAWQVWIACIAACKLKMHRTDNVRHRTASDRSHFSPKIKQQRELIAVRVDLLPRRQILSGNSTKPVEVTGRCREVP